MKKALIDTNIYSYAMKGDTDITYHMKKMDVIGISTISIGELLSGFKGGHREEQNRNELNVFLDSPRVVVHSIDEDTADFYASILDNLRNAGTPIPTNDIWIASVAFQHGYKLFSKDKHFSYIPGIVRFSE